MSLRTAEIKNCCDKCHSDYWLTKAKLASLIASPSDNTLKESLKEWERQVKVKIGKHFDCVMIQLSFGIN